MSQPVSTETFNTRMERLMMEAENKQTADYLKRETEAVERANEKVARRAWRRT